MGVWHRVIERLKKPSTYAYVFGIVLALQCLWPWDMLEFRQSRFLGANEAQVRRMVGKPDFDSREKANQGGIASDDDFILSYNGAWGRFYMIHLQNGSVDRVEHRYK